MKKIFIKYHNNKIDELVIADYFIKQETTLIEEIKKQIDKYLNLKKKKFNPRFWNKISKRMLGKYLFKFNYSK